MWLIVPSPRLLIQAFDNPEMSVALPFFAERTARPTAFFEAAYLYAMAPIPWWYIYRPIRFLVDVFNMIRYGFYGFFV